MIRPDEVERTKDLGTASSNAIVDLCRPRALVLAKAPEQAVPLSQDITLIEYRFSDGQGGSGLARGDIIRGEIWGRWSVDGTVPNFTFTVVAAGQVMARIIAMLVDTAGDTCAFSLTYFVRLEGGEDSTLNSPAKGNAAAVRSGMRASFGDNFADPQTISSQVILPEYITVSTPTPSPPSINLAAPLSIKVQLNTKSSCQIYGGYMEGL